MAKLPSGALLQKNSNGVQYVFFPSYYYDKSAQTVNKEKQKRVYIGKMVDGKFVPNDFYRANKSIGRKDAPLCLKAKQQPIQAKSLDLSRCCTRSYAATYALLELAKTTKLSEDLVAVYGEEDAADVLSLALYMILNANSSLYLYPEWSRRFHVPSSNNIDSQYSSRLLKKIGQNEVALNSFFSLREKHIRAREFLSYDSTKIGSEAEDISDVRWAPSKAGGYREEISLAVLCGQKSRIPVMFRVLPGNMTDVKTVRDLVCRWKEIGIDSEATAVMDRGYNSLFNLADLCANGVKFVMAQKTSTNLVKECIDSNMPAFWESGSYIGDYGVFGISRKQTIVGADGRQHKVWVHAFRSDWNCKLAFESMERKLRAFEKEWQDGIASKSSATYKLFVPTEKEPGAGSTPKRNFAAIDSALRYKGFFAFVSDYISSPLQMMEIYRGRDCVEKTFANLQTGLDLKSAGVHHDETLRGKLLVCMVALTMMATLSYSMEKKSSDDERRLYDDYTLSGLLSELTNVLLVSCPGFEPRLTEMTSKQSLIFERLKLPNPLTLKF